MTRINYKNIEIPKGVELYIIGDIHEHWIQFNKLMDLIQPSAERWVVSVGDIYDKGFGREFGDKITDRFKEYCEAGYGFVVKGNHELKLIKKNKKADYSDRLRWWNNQPTALTFSFYNRNLITVVHGGITPNHTYDNLQNSIDFCYVRDIDSLGEQIPLIWKEVDGQRLLFKEQPGKLWHYLYNGRFGLVVSGHISQLSGVARRYNNSINIDTGVYYSGVLTAVRFDSKGKYTEVIGVSGPAANPKLPIMY